MQFPYRCGSVKCRSKKWLDGKDKRINNKWRFVVPVTEEQHGQFERAARKDGTGVGDWLTGLATKEITVPQKPAPQVRTIEHQGIIENNTPSPVGFGLDVAAFLAKKNIQITALAEKPPAPRKSWRALLAPIQAAWFSDPSQAAEDLNTILGGNRPPSEYASWYLTPKTLTALVEHLDTERPLDD